MNLGVVGSRTITDTDVVRDVLERAPFMDSLKIWWFSDVDVIVSGGANGVDSCVEELAEQYSIEMDIIEPDHSDWSGNEHPAKRRNTEIVKRSDVIVAVWNGHSNGTRDTIDKALDRGVPIYVEVVE